MAQETMIFQCRAAILPYSRAQFLSLSDADAAGSTSGSEPMSRRGRRPVRTGGPLSNLAAMWVLLNYRYDQGNRDRGDRVHEQLAHDILLLIGSWHIDRVVRHYRALVRRAAEHSGR